MPQLINRLIILDVKLLIKPLYLHETMMLSRDDICWKQLFT